MKYIIRLVITVTLLSILPVVIPSGTVQSDQNGEAPLPPSVVLIEQAYRSGQIDYDTTIEYKVLSIFNPQRLPAEYQSTTPAKCATPILMEVNRNWQILRPETKDRLSFYPVARLYDGLRVLLRPTLSGTELTYSTTHFEIHYTTSGDDAVDTTDSNSNGIPDYIESMGTELENVWGTELSAMGWLQPPSDVSWDGNSDYDVYVHDMIYYGYADPEAFADQGSAVGDNENSTGVTEVNAAYCYIALENDYSGFPNTPLYNIRVTAAHEFNHAIQFGYDVFEETWLMEATAVWMEDEVYDAINDNLQYLPDYFNNPDVAMPSETPGLHWYADWIFARYISEHHGGQSTMRGVWENSVNYDSYYGYYSFNAIQDALSSVGTSLPAVFDNFTVANYVMSTSPTNSPYCYEEASSYPSVYIEGNINFSGSTVNYTPSDGVGNYAADYITINSTVDQVQITVSGASSGITYAASVIGMQSGVPTVVDIPMSGGPDSGSVTLGTASYDTVILIVLNETPDSSSLTMSDYSVLVTDATSPTVTSVTPSSADPGHTLDVTITGTNFTGATAVSFGTGIAVTSFNVDNDTQITANITIAVDAALGTRNVSVTTPEGTGTLTDGFTVTGALEAQWTTNGPYGGYINSLAMAPTNPDIIYAGTQRGVFRTVDGGATWVKTGLPETWVRVVQVDPGNPDIVYAGTNDGVYKSEDGGSTWMQKGLSGARVNAIAIDPLNPHVLYAGTGQWLQQATGEITGIFKSMDGGETWQEKVSDGLDAVAALLIDTDNSSCIYAGVYPWFPAEYGFLKSTDGGETWTSKDIDPSYTADEVVALAMTPTGFNPPVIYASGGGYGGLVYKSTDRGESWTRTNYNIPFVFPYRNGPESLAVDPNDPDIVYAGTPCSRIVGTAYFHSELYKSVDGGNTWSQRDNGLPEGAITNIVIDPRNSDFYVSLGAGGVYKSTDGADSWNISSQGINITYIEGLAIHPTSSDTAFAAIWSGGHHLAKTTNGGTSWDYLLGSDTPTGLGAVAIDPQNPSTIFVGDDYGFHESVFVHKSIDGGLSWTSTELFSKEYATRGVTDIWINPSDSNIILAALAGEALDGVYRSTNGGETWQPASDPAWVNTLAANPNNPDIVYFGTSGTGSVSQSTDGGINWTDISPGEYWVWSVRDIEVDLNSRVYAATDEGLWRWDGSDWTVLTGLPTDDITDLAIDTAASPGIIYVGTGEEGVFFSQDGGNTWTPFSEGLGTLNITRLAVSASQPKILYAGTYYGGVYSSSPPALNTPPEVTNVTASQSSPIVNITYDVSDAEQSEVTIGFEYWDGASWQVCITATGDGTQNTGTGKSGTWNAKTDFDEHYMTDCKIRVTADDGQAENNIGSGESSPFSLDTKDPTGYGCNTPINGATLVSVNPDLTCLTASDDSPTIFYYFQLAENDTFTQGLQESGWQGSSIWSPSSLGYNKQYFWKVKAKDDYGNETDYGSSFNFTTQAEAGASATRTLPASVDPGAHFDVTITASGCGICGQVVETLPSGFSYVSCASSDVSPTPEDNMVKFTFVGDSVIFTYTVKASTTQGIYTFSGIVKDENKVEYPVGGDTSITVGFDPMHYDEDEDGVMEIGEVLNAISDYFADEITITEVLEVIALYFAS